MSIPNDFFDIENYEQRRQEAMADDLQYVEDGFDTADMQTTGPIGVASRDAEGVREFASGATRNVDTSQPDYEAFLSPLVIQRYGEFMHQNRFRPNGELRDGDDWQKGIPMDSYMKSGWRHFFAWWRYYRNGGGQARVLEDAICALLFNAMGYLHEFLKNKDS